MEGLAVGERTRKLVEELRKEWSALDERIDAYDEEFAALTRTDAQARRPSTIPGVGIINATALMAAMERLAKARYLAS